MKRRKVLTNEERTKLTVFFWENRDALSGMRMVEIRDKMSQAGLGDSLVSHNAKTLKAIAESAGVKVARGKSFKRPADSPVSHRQRRLAAIVMRFASEAGYDNETDLAYLRALAGGHHKAPANNGEETS